MMEDSKVRIKEIVIRDFRNVKYGKLSFDNARQPFDASVLGLYGQNGSGKTTLIDAIEILHYALRGRSIPSDFGDYINLESEFSSFSFVFSLSGSDGSYEVFYDFCMREEKNSSRQNLDTDHSDESCRVVIFDEVLSYSFKPSKEGEKSTRKAPFIDTRTNGVFVPSSKYTSLMGKDKETETNLLVAKKLAGATSRSFIFSKELWDAAEKKNSSSQGDAVARYLFILRRLIFFGNFELFVIQTLDIGVISLNALPLSFKYNGGKHLSAGQILLPLDQAEVIPEKTAGMAQNVLNSINVVLQQIIPNLTIELKSLGTEVLKDGTLGKRVQLMANNNGSKLPLKYESEGIKKIISILNLLIAVYNQPSVTVAVDELDSGVFEYLLGEILRIISERGKGQLIFTSHNLRPLETLDRSFVAFTTINPENRYVRIPNVKDSNNLRSYYYRDLALGISKEPLYQATNNAEIDLAFREAGEIGDAEDA